MALSKQHYRDTMIARRGRAWQTNFFFLRLDINYVAAEEVVKM